MMVHVDYLSYNYLLDNYSDSFKSLPLEMTAIQDLMSVILVEHRAATLILDRYSNVYSNRIWETSLKLRRHRVANINYIFDKLKGKARYEYRVR